MNLRTQKHPSVSWSCVQMKIIEQIKYRNTIIVLPTLKSIRISQHTDLWILPSNTGPAPFHRLLSPLGTVHSHLPYFLACKDEVGSGQVYMLQDLVDLKNQMHSTCKKKYLGWWPNIYSLIKKNIYLHTCICVCVQIKKKKGRRFFSSEIQLYLALFVQPVCK